MAGCVNAQVDVNETAVRSLTVVNVGRFMFDYSWELKCQSPALVTISPLSGTVAQGDKADCVLTFQPSHPLTLKHCDLSLRVSSLNQHVPYMFCNVYSVLQCFDTLGWATGSTSSL